MKFPLGTLYVTPGAIEIFANGVNIGNLVARHAEGDWGDISDNDKEENELSLKEGFRLLSSYNTVGGKIWIITEADRSSTTVLLPEEY